MAASTGLEPAISNVTDWRGLQLPYEAICSSFCDLRSCGDAYGIRIRVTGLKGLGPRPLDESAW